MFRVTFLVLLMATTAATQSVAEIQTPAVTMARIDFGLLPPGPTTIQAINGIAVPAVSPLAGLTPHSSTAAAGVYNTNALANGLGFVSGVPTVLSVPGGFTNFDGVNIEIHLTGPSTEIGFAVTDWTGSINASFYLGGVLQATLLSSQYANLGIPQIKYFRMSGGTFDSVLLAPTTPISNYALGNLDLQVLQGLVPDCTATPPVGPSPLTVQFTDTSFSSHPGGVVAWNWDFDNDGIVDSTAQNPTHTFTGCGDFDVRLEVFDGSATGSATRIFPAMVRTDEVTADFTVALVAPPNVYQFTDTSSPTPTSWQWDFDNDGIVDSTQQNPAFVAPAGCLSQVVKLDVARACRTGSVTRPVFDPGVSSLFEGEVAGGTGTGSAVGVGNYFDIEVTNSEIVVCGLSVSPLSPAGTIFDCNVYLTDGSHVGKEGDASQWRLVGTGQGVSGGGGTLAPVLVDVGMQTPFALPAGAYGVGVFLSGGQQGIVYTIGSGQSPYTGADLVIHPNGLGSATQSELGPATFSPRLWNGGFYYETCNATSFAAAGLFGTGCPGSSGTPSIDPATNVPRLGTTFQFDVTNVPNGLGVIVFGLSHSFSSTLGALPFSLAPLGAPGCLWRVSSDYSDVFTTATNIATTGLAIPSNGSLQCMHLFVQAAVLSNGSNALGFVASDAMFGVLGL